MGSTRFARTASGLLVPRPQFFNGNCPCCGTPPTCDILSTDFNMANGTTLPTGWPTTTGWNINTNKLRGPATGSPIISSVSAPTSYMAVSVAVASVSSTSAYLYAANARLQLLNTGSSTILILSRDIGGGTYVEVDRYTDATHSITSGTMTLCTKSTGVVCGAMGAMHAGSTFPAITGTDFGLATFSTGVTFDDFLARTVSADCDDCTACPTSPLKCGQCDPIYYAPVSATLEFSGTPGSGCCSIDGVWVIPLGSGQTCSGSVARPACPSTSWAVGWSIITVSGKTVFEVTLAKGSTADCSATTIIWRYTIDDPDTEDCSGVKSLTLFSQTFGTCGTCPDMTGSTVTMEVNLT